MADEANTQQPIPQSPDQVPVQAPAVPVPTPVEHVVIKTPVQKKGGKISPRTFAIGCIAFIVLLVGLIFAAGYAGIQNPTALASIGMNADQAKTLLMIVSGAFFGILFFVSFTFLGLNIYRLMKAKNTPKGKFIIGIIISLFLLSVSIGIGAFAILSIQKINTQKIYSKNLVVGYIAAYKKGDKERTLIELEDIDRKPVVAAPAQIYMKVNETFRLALLTKLGTSQLVSKNLLCGNGDGNKPSQSITLEKLLPSDGSNASSDVMDAPCLYTKKGSYNLELAYTYFDKATQQTRSDKMPVGTITIPAEIILTNDGIRLQTNDAQTEILAGDSPARIIFDAKKVFTDVQLNENLILWDLNGDGTDESTKANKAFFSTNYTEGKLYTVSYRLPGNQLSSLYYYSFPLRVLQSDVPGCRITKQAGENNSTIFNGIRDEGGTEIDTMRFEVYNLTKEQTVQSLPTQRPTFTYTFSDKDQYVVRLVYTTIDKKKSFCESETINETSAVYTINTTLFGKKTDASSFSQLTDTGTLFVQQDKSIIATVAPFDIQIRIDSISPQPPENASISVLINDQAMNAIKSNLFSTRVYGPQPQTIKIFIDDGQGNTTEKIRDVRFEQDPLIGNLRTNTTTGVDPLTISFDASSITATDSDDEIVYFSRDFGDGKTAKNISQAKIEHTYIFDTVAGNGTYSPSVRVQTKKGHTATFMPTTPISVSRKASNIGILVPSHPTQVANVGDTISFTMESDGYVTSTLRDFGDESPTKECEFRSCADITHVFSTPGTYSVRVTATYQGLPSATTSINVKVE